MRPTCTRLGRSGRPSAIGGRCTTSVRKGLPTIGSPMTSSSGIWTFGPHWSIRRCRGPTNPTAHPTRVDHYTRLGGDNHLPCHCKEDELHKAEMKHLEDEPAGPLIDEDEVWDKITNDQKKGQVYRKGKVPKRPAPRLVDPEDASTCSGPDARENITLMNREIQQQAEAYKREMEAWKRRYETDMTHLQTTLDTQCRVLFLDASTSASTAVISSSPSSTPTIATASALTPTDGSSSDDEDYD
ncbi:hypothetical protein PIB30_099415 [Stylosanthes scabra]|uniref:Uncharacterized protein n=1 Tax=Stylosanthes scabra TaxID=79078 RepID=A0ABU6WZX5_9FABA|nr:hypothetical protein [Stylosanthes scabra]